MKTTLDVQLKDSNNPICSNAVNVLEERTGDAVSEAEAIVAIISEAGFDVSEIEEMIEDIKAFQAVLELAKDPIANITIVFPDSVSDALATEILAISTEYSDVEIVEILENVDATVATLELIIEALEDELDRLEELGEG